MIPIPRRPLFLFALCTALITGTLALTGCASRSAAPHASASSSLSPAEKAVLREYHYPGSDPYAITSDLLEQAQAGDRLAIDRFLEDSTLPDLDGAAGQIYSRDLCYLLFVLGDDRFAQELARQPAGIRRKIARMLHHPLSRPGLSYPKTRAALRSHG